MSARRRPIRPCCGSVMEGDEQESLHYGDGQEEEPSGDDHSSVDASQTTEETSNQQKDDAQESVRYEAEEERIPANDDNVDEPNQPRPFGDDDHFDLASGMRVRRRQSIKQVQKVPRSSWEKLIWRTRRRLFDDVKDDQQDRWDKVYRIRSQYAGRSAVYKYVEQGGYMARVLSEGFRWTFRSNFWSVFLVAYALFLTLVTVFAGLIFLISHQRPECVATGSYAVDSTRSLFLDAFHLSWTTFSSVGYGATFPAVGDHLCVGINTLMALEAFVGVMFGSISSAVIVSKVARVQSVANVVFSHPICVRYGTGVMPSGENEDEDDPEANEKLDCPCPCPILEFRLVNRLSNIKGGEIVDARVSVVATTLVDYDKVASLRRPVVWAESDANEEEDESAQPSYLSRLQSSGVKLFEAGPRAMRATGSLLQHFTYGLSLPDELPGIEAADVDPVNEEEIAKQFESQLASQLHQKGDGSSKRSVLQAVEASIMVDEGDHDVAPRRIFHKLRIQTNRHPFFKRVWNISHRLDQHSPLLTRTARRMIQDNNGCWPKELNDCASVRKHLRFKEIIVNFSGTANVSGSTVFAQKAYDFVHTNIGYTFANLLCTSGTGQLVVDHELVNDVREQRGGGAEPLADIVVPEEPSAALVAHQAAQSANRIVAATKSIVGRMEHVETEQGSDMYLNTPFETSIEKVPEQLRVVIDNGESDESDEDDK